ncbi:GTPase-activating Rap/Ran-GAP domain-like protein 3, partial [Cladochytrium tenue]
MDAVGTKDTLYHRRCFRCSTCSRSLKGSGSADSKGRLFCSRHRPSLDGSDAPASDVAHPPPADVRNTRDISRSSSASFHRPSHRIALSLSNHVVVVCSPPSSSEGSLGAESASSLPDAPTQSALASARLSLDDVRPRKSVAGHRRQFSNRLDDVLRVDVPSRIVGGQGRLVQDRPPVLPAYHSHDDFISSLLKPLALSTEDLRSPPPDLLSPTNHDARPEASPQVLIDEQSKLTTVDAGLLLNACDAMSANMDRVTTADLPTTLFNAVVSGTRAVAELASGVADVHMLNEILREAEKRYADLGDFLECRKPQTSGLERVTSLKGTVESLISYIPVVVGCFKSAAMHLMVPLSPRFWIEAVGPSNSIGYDPNVSAKRNTLPPRPAFEETNPLSAGGNLGALGDRIVHHAILRVKGAPNLYVTIPEAEIFRRTSLVSRGRVSPRAILSCIDPEVQSAKVKRVKDKRIEQKVMEVDEMNAATRFKFGVLYCRPGQTTEEEFFSNETGSPAFDEFLGVLGDRVDLRGFTGFLGGLDSKADNTGVQSLHACWRNFEMMFHVSTLLPFSKDDPQQIQRKRHIGNDIVCVVFLDGDMVFDPASIKSQFLHIFVV